MTDRIYLDNAATSWPKPLRVYDAIDRYQRENGAPAGRGAYEEAVQTERTIAKCRRQLAKLINAGSENEIAFACNGTAGLNAVIHGWLKPGDHVVTTVCEHNSVLRPLKELENSGMITVTRVSCDSTGNVDPESIRRAIVNETRLIAVIHVSNVSGAVLPIDTIGKLAGEYAVPLLVDAAQSVGCLPIDVRESNISFLAAPGHKSLWGPLGSGFFYAAAGYSDQLQPVQQGGTGTVSDSDIQPKQTPEKFESGNLNVPAIVGLSEGIEFIESESIEEIGAKVSRLTTLLIDGLSRLDSVTVYGQPKSESAKSRGSVVTFNIAGYDSREVAGMLESGFRIQVRSGFHCAPLIHNALNTGAGGAVRMSPGYFNSTAQIETAIEAIRQIAESTGTIS